MGQLRAILFLVLTGIFLSNFLVNPQRANAIPTDLFFSEYVEGSSNNKALEIFNGTGADIDLAAGSYNIQFFFNGSSTPAPAINLTGVISDGDVYVIADDGAVQAILDEADQTPGNSFFNGDDAVALLKGGTFIDVIGQIGNDPGTQWGSELTSTRDNTLRRKPTIQSGDPNESDFFDPSIEWEGFPVNTFAGLGTHQINQSPQPIPEPMTLLLLGSGLLGLSAWQRIKRHGSTSNHRNGFGSSHGNSEERDLGHSQSHPRETLSCWQNGQVSHDASGETSGVDRTGGSGISP